MRWPALVVVVVVVSVATCPLRAQRPRTLDEALARHRAVAGAPERDRQRAVRDLGEFADAAASAALLDELERAESDGHRITVLRALGRHPRAGAAAPLARVLRTADNPRVCDAAGEALAGQDDAGVDELARVLAAERSGGMRRNAACEGLSRAAGERARDVLLAELQRSGGRERLPLLRALSRRPGDAQLDPVRLQLAGDKDALVAAAAIRQLADHDHPNAAERAFALARRLDAAAEPQVHSAVLAGLLQAPATDRMDALLTAAARADDPFGAPLRSRWTAALAEPQVATWLADRAAGRKVAAERAAAATALGFAAAPTQAVASRGLARLAADGEPGVARAALAALAIVDTDAARAAVTTLLARANDTILPVALAAAHPLRRDEPGWVDDLLRFASHQSGPVRAAALRLLGEMATSDDPRFVAAGADSLAHSHWPVRAAAIELLARSRQRAAVPLLFGRLDHESARLRQDVVGALRGLTGLWYPTTTAWRDWWRQAEATFAPLPAGRPTDRQAGAEQPAATAATYWNIPVHSDRVTFVVDVSGSMLQPFGTGGATRLDEAKRQLARVLEQLPAKAKFNVIAFADSTRSFGPNLQPLDGRRRKAADAFVADLQARGATDVHEALQVAFADTEVDTLFLLTDGQPSSGAIVDPDQLASEVARWNIGRQLRIHTVSIGGASPFLARLASDSGGEHAVAR